MSDYYVGPISPRDKRRQAQMDALLAQEGIARDKNLTYSAGIFDDDGQMIATGSSKGYTASIQPSTSL